MKIKLLFLITSVQVSFGMDNSLKLLGTFTCEHSQKPQLIAFHPENNKIALLSKIAINQEHKYVTKTYDITTKETSEVDCPAPSPSDITALAFDEYDKIIFKFQNNKINTFNPLTKKFYERTDIQKQTNNSPEKTQQFTVKYLDNKKTIELWNIKTQQRSHIISHNHPITTHAFNPHQTQLITISDDDTANIYLVKPPIIIQDESNQSYELENIDDNWKMLQTSENLAGMLENADATTLKSPIMLPKTVTIIDFQIALPFMKLIHNPTDISLPTLVYMRLLALDFDALCTLLRINDVLDIKSFDNQQTIDKQPKNITLMCLEIIKEKLNESIDMNTQDNYLNAIETLPLNHNNSIALHIAAQFINDTKPKAKEYYPSSDLKSDLRHYDSKKITKIIITDWKARIVCCKTEESIALFQENLPQVTAVAFSQNDKFVITGFHTGLIKIWDKNNTKESLLTLTGHTKKINSVAFNHDNSKVVSGSDDCTAKIWDTLSGKCIITYDHYTKITQYSTNSSPYEVTAVKFIDHGKKVLTNGYYLHNSNEWPSEDDQSRMVLINNLQARMAMLIKNAHNSTNKCIYLLHNNKDLEAFNNLEKEAQSYLHKQFTIRKSETIPTVGKPQIKQSNTTPKLNTNTVDKSQIKQSNTTTKPNTNNKPSIWNYVFNKSTMLTATIFIAGLVYYYKYFKHLPKII